MDFLDSFNSPYLYNLSNDCYNFLQVVYFTATFPYVVLLIFIIKGFTLDGFDDGLKFFFIPRVRKFLSFFGVVFWILSNIYNETFCGKKLTVNIF